MNRRALRSLFDAWRRGGGREAVRGVLGRAELQRLRAHPLDEAYRRWLVRHRNLWTQHSARDDAAGGQVLPIEGGPAAWNRTDAAFVVGLGAADTLHPGALHLLGDAIRAGAQVVYADEDQSTPSGPGAPLLKPAWSEVLALSFPEGFPGRPTAIAAPLWNRICDESPDRTWVELVLRATEAAERISHIPLPLVTRGAPIGDADQAAVRNCLRRRGIDARAEPGRTARSLRIRLAATDQRVSVLIPTRDQPELLNTIADALEREAALQPLERIWLDHATADPRARQRLDQESRRPHSQVLRLDGPFNFSRMINTGARVATGDALLLLNNDIEPLADGWIRDLMATAQLPGVHAVGPLLRYPDRSVQHAGIALGVGTVTGHLFRTLADADLRDQVGPCVGPAVAREVAAVTGACLLVRREEFLAAGGLDEERLPVSFSDVSLCLELRRRGGRVLYDPAIELVHHETVSRSAQLDPREVAWMRARWGAELAADPYLPPALSRLSEWPLLARHLSSAVRNEWSRA